MVEEKASFVRKFSRRERAAFFIKKINQYNSLARTAKKVGGYLGRNAVTSWRDGREDMVEWNERKGGQMYEMDEYYEKEAANASNGLHKIIGASNPTMHRWRRLQIERDLWIWRLL